LLFLLLLWFSCIVNKKNAFSRFVCVIAKLLKTPRSPLLPSPQTGGHAPADLQAIMAVWGAWHWPGGGGELPEMQQQNAV